MIRGNEFLTLAKGRVRNGTERIEVATDLAEALWSLFDSNSGEDFLKSVSDLIALRKAERDKEKRKWRATTSVPEMKLPLSKTTKATPFGPRVLDLE